MMVESASNDDTIKTLMEEVRSLREQMAAMRTEKAPVRSNNPPMILKEDSAFDVWMDVIKSELTSANHGIYLENPVKDDGGVHFEVEKDEVKQKLAFVKSYIMSRVDDTYKTQIHELKMPYEIVKRLNDIFNPNLWSNLITLERRWSNLKIAEGESVLKFTNRFENMLRKLRQMGSKIEEFKVVGNYALSLQQQYPELVRRFDLQKDLTIDDMRKLALNLESTDVESKARLDDRGGNVTVNLAEGEKRKVRVENGTEKRIITCFNCGKPNHTARECKNPKKICYNCGKLGSHTAKECTAPRAQFPKVGMFPSNRSNNQQRSNSYVPNKQQKRSYDDGGKNKMYRKVKIKGADGKERIAMVACGDGQEEIIEIGDCNVGELYTCDINKNDVSEGILEFIADSGATEHIIKDDKYLINKRELKNARIRSANKNHSADLKVVSIGELAMVGYNNNNFSLTNVLHAPEVVQNLLSLRKMVNAGIQISLDSNSIILSTSGGLTMCTGHYTGRFWILKLRVNLYHVSQPSKCFHSASEINHKKIFPGEVCEPKRDVSFPSQKTEGSVSCNSVSTCPSNIHRLGVSCTNGMAGCIRGSSDHSYAKNSEITTEPGVNRSMVLDDHTYSQTNNDTDVSNNENVSEQLVEFNSKNVEYTSTKEKYDEILKNLVEASDQSHKNEIKKNPALLWHCRLGHVSRTYLKKAAKYIPELNKINFDALGDCSTCIKAKAVKKASLTTRYRSSEPLSLIHTDVIGPISPCTYKYGNKYIITFLDDATRFCWCYPMADKKSVHLAVLKLLETIRKMKGQNANIRAFRLDNGTEYLTDEMKSLVSKEKINLESVPPYSSNLNGAAEKLNLDLEQKIRSLIFDSGFPKEMWAYALKFAVDVHNKTPKKALLGEIPYCKFLERPCTVKYFRRFGCLSFVLNTFQKLEKFEDRTLKGFLVSCGDDSYHVIDPETGKVYRSKNVDFIESITFSDVYSNGINKTVFTRGVERDEEGSQFWKTEGSNREANWLDNLEDVDALNVEQLYEKVNVNSDPTTFQEAVNSPEKKLWEVAIKDELDSLNKNKTWELVKSQGIPKGAILTSRWAFKKKEEPNGSIRYKARLVVRGFQDRTKYEINETYSPVIRLTDFRFLLAAANKFNLKISQMDVKTAFLNGELENEIFMHIPEGVVGKEKLESEYVCKLVKALYGLRVSPRRWYVRFRDAMEKFGFTVYPFQSCIFWWRNETSFVIVALYVDDLFIVGNNNSKIQRLKQCLRGEFEMVDLGEPKKFLGLEIVRNEEQNSVFLHQRRFTEKTLAKFGMNECNATRTPMLTHETERKLKNLNDVESNVDVSKLPFRQAVGTLLYLSNGTRPDLSFVVNAISRKQSNYTVEDWAKIKKVFRYLKGTLEYGLKFVGKSDEIECFVDASLGTSDSEGKSTTGLVLKIFGDLVFWRTKRQTHVALSSAEAEYIAMSQAAKELISLKEMSKRLLKIETIPIMYEDNKAAICIAKSDDSQSLKHVVNLCFHFIRFEVAKGNLKIVWINTDKQEADFLTKALGGQKFEYFRDCLMCKLN